VAGALPCTGSSAGEVRAVFYHLLAVPLLASANATGDIRLQIDPAVFQDDCLAPAEFGHCPRLASPSVGTGAPSSSAALLTPEAGGQRLLRADLRGLLGSGPELSCGTARAPGGRRRPGGVASCDWER
jgi:hypothetical protein